MLFKGCNLCSSANLDTTEIIFYRGNNSRPCDGLILGAKGNRMFHVVDRADGTTHQRHLDQISLTTPKKESHEESVVLREEISEPKPSEVDAEEVIIAKEVIDAVDENVTARELRRG